MPRMPRQSARTRALRERERRARLRAADDREDRFKKSVGIFESQVKGLIIYSCEKCHRKCWSDELVNDWCNLCRKTNRETLFSAENGMDLGLIPPELQDLSLIEQLLIARVHPVISVFRIRGQQTGYSGHTVNFVQHIENIATRLPHCPASLDSIILMNRTTPHGVVQFRVRSGRVRKALIWLKVNNQYYRDIIIDEQVLMDLPADDDVSHLLPNCPAEYDATEEEQTDNIGENIITSSCVPNLPAVDSANAIDRHLQRLIPQSQDSQDNTACRDWPEVGNARLNEYTTEGLICKAFPCLFPYGRGDLHAPRLYSISAHTYFKYLLDYHDGRFANDPRFPYYAYNTMARWDAINCGNVFIRHNHMDDVTADRLHDMVNNPDQDIASRIMYYGTNLRGTRAYWKQRSSELDQMVRQLGTPTIFFTLSAADYHWPDLYRLLSPGANPSSLSERERLNLMHDNPLITAKFFEKRTEIFVEKFMKTFFDIEDFWMRYEWQHRGSPHVHGMLWLKEAPDCSKLDLDSVDASTMERITKYFDELVSATVNHQYTITPRDNPCRKRYTDLSEDEKSRDLDRILCAVQTHSRCGNHCIRKRRATRNFECRYGFPIDLEEKSSMRKEDGVWKFFPQRNNKLLQRYNKFVTRAWRGNTDFSPITSKDAVIRYISKYASKGEHASESYSEILRRLTSKNAPDTSASTIIRQLVVSTVAERNYSAQEIMHLAMGWPLYRATRTFIVLNTDNGWRHIEDERDNLTGYYSRRQGLEDLTLFHCAKSFRVSNRTIVERTKDCIVRVLPYLKLSEDPTEKEKYYKQQCKLHLPWRGTFEESLPVGTTWEENYLANIDNLGSSNQSYANEYPQPEELEYEDAPEDHARIDRDAGMAAARIHPGVNQLDPIGHRPIDEAFVWSDTQSSDLDNEKVSEFFKAYKIAPVHARDRSQCLTFASMSQAQQDVINICKCQIADPNFATKRVLVQGKAGTGKSAVIKYLCNLIQSASNEGEVLYQVVAPTGAAALNVDGETIHKFFGLPQNACLTPLNGESLRLYQLKMQNLKFLIIDEYSMVGMRLMTKIHKRLREARPQNHDPFAGVNIYLFGDLRQLPPVMDTAIYMKPNDDFSTVAMGLINSIQKKVLLTVCHRQSTDQVAFKQALDNLAMGKSTEQDWRLFMSRRSAIAPTNMRCFKDSIHLFPTNVQVKEHNLRILSMNTQAVCVIDAEHNTPMAVKCAEPQAQGLSSTLYLSIGCRVMLRKNLDVTRGLVNGSLGTVREIIFKHGDKPPVLPFVLLIEFDGYRGPFIKENLYPLLPTTVTWLEKGVECKRKQFPINLAYALTIHKSQGLTLDRVVVDIGERDTAAGLSYVAFSRVRRIEDLLIANSFNLSRLTGISELPQIGKRELFLQNLQM